MQSQQRLRDRDFQDRTSSPIEAKCGYGGGFPPRSNLKSHELSLVEMQGLELDTAAPCEVSHVVTLWSPLALRI